MGLSEDLYDNKNITFLEAIWGKGYLSPGGSEEIAKLLDGVDLSKKTVLDIGCGSGGITLSLVQDYGALHVIGIDVEAPVCRSAHDRVKDAGLLQLIEIKHVNPGPFAFNDNQFDTIFSKDSIIHITDKESLIKEVFRVLKPGGLFVASDWLISHDDEPSLDMKDYIKLEDLDFSMASPERYRCALESAGFVSISMLNRNNWYLQKAKQELIQLQNLQGSKLELTVGKELITANIKTWNAMIKVLQSGEHCPHHFKGRKP